MFVSLMVVLAVCHVCVIDGCVGGLSRLRHRWLCWQFVTFVSLMAVLAPEGRPGDF